MANIFDGAWQAMETPRGERFRSEEEQNTSEDVMRKQFTYRPLSEEES